MGLSQILKEIPDGLSPLVYGEIVYELTKDQYKEKPVDIETFVKDPYYLGNIYGKSIFPFWMKLLKQIYPSPIVNPYNEVILSCGTGSGKSVATTISLAYEIHKLMCLECPQDYYGIAPHTTFVVSLFSLNKGVAVSVNWGYFSSIFGNSPYFKENIMVPKGKSTIADEGVRLTNDISIHVGSSLGNALGKAVFAAVLDEANFSNTQGKDPKDLYSGIIDRRKSRFIQYGGQVPGVVWLSSSPNDENDYVSQRIKEVQTNKYCYILDNVPRWEVHKCKGIYSGETFKVFLGDEKRDPSIVSNESDVTKDMLDRIIKVPVEHKKEFEVNVVRSLRDIAGRRISGETSLFSSKEQLRKVLVAPLRFTKEIIPLSFDGKDKVEDFISNVDYFRSPLHPYSYRFIHLDIATSEDKYGISSTYSTIENIIVTPKNFQMDINALRKRERIFYTDFAIAIEAQKGQQINLQKIVDFILYLKHIGYPIYKISCDLAHSTAAHTKQQLELAGFTVDYVSLDRSKEPYESFKETVIGEKYIGPRHELLITELYGLRDMGKKFDHPVDGSKDVADAVAGSYWSCATSDVFKDNSYLFDNTVNFMNNDSVSNRLENLYNEQLRRNFNNIWGI